MQDISGKKVAILSTDGFEQVELTEPLAQLRKAGAEVHVIAPEEGEIRGWDKTDWGESVKVDRKVSDCTIDDYDALVLPGGQINPDKLRTVPEAVDFVRNFHNSKKPIGAICHGPWMLIEAGIVKGRRMTSYHSIQTDMRNAGADWVDQEVVVDEGIVTSRNPGDLEAFCAKVVEEISEGRHTDRQTA